MKKYFPFILFLSLFIFISCKSEKEQDKTDKSHSMGVATLLGNITYSPSEGWVSEMPTSKMRRAQFRLPGKEGAGDAELAVFVFPGGGGSVKANIERWLDQFKQPDGSDTRKHTDTKIMESNGLHVTTIYTTGTYLGSAVGMRRGGPVEELPGYAMMAAIVETSADPWFFKAVGPEKTINAWRSEFDTFVTTIKRSE